MTDNNRPITSLPKLVQQWLCDYYLTKFEHEKLTPYILSREDERIIRRALESLPD